MDDEEYSYAALQEPLYRVETGNYEYRSVFYSYWKVIVKINHRSWLCKFDTCVLHIVFGWKYMYSLCQVIVSIFFGQFLIKNTHTFERNAVETNVREKNWIWFFLTHYYFLLRENSHKWKQISYGNLWWGNVDIFSPFEVTWNILSHVLKSNKPVKAFQRRNLGYFFIVLNEYRLNPEIFINIK